MINPRKTSVIRAWRSEVVSQRRIKYFDQHPFKEELKSRILLPIIIYILTKGPFTLLRCYLVSANS